MSMERRKRECIKFMKLIEFIDAFKEMKSFEKNIQDSDH